MNSLMTDQQQSFDNPLTVSSGQTTKIDKMALMKAYETILRKEGILPVSDSKIYKLVFKVFQKCERTLKSNQSHLSDSLSSSKNVREIENQIHQSLQEHQRSTDMTQKAFMYNDFRLQRRAFDGFRYILTQQISQDKENFRPKQKNNEADQQIFKDSLNITSKSQNRSKQQMYIGGGPNDSLLNESNHLNLPRAASIGSTVFTSSRQQEFKQFSFKEELNNSLLKQGFTESNACMSGFFDRPISSKPTLPPRDSKRPQQHQNILNNNSSSEINSQGFMRINVYPSQNSSNSNINQLANPFQGLMMPFPQSTKHQPDYNLLDQSSINQIPASHSFLSYSNLPDDSYHPVRQPRKSSHVSSGQALKAPRNNNIQWSSDMNIVMSPAKEEDDYLLLVQYLRRWQKALTLIKRQRDAKRRLLENLATAINFHEHILATKALLSFIKYRVIKEQERMKQLKCNQKVERNIIKFYFRMLIVKFKESRYTKSGNHMAQVFRQKKTLKSTIQSWHHVVHQNKMNLHILQHSYQANIRPAMLLIDIIGGFYLNKSHYNRLDVIELYQVSKHYGRAGYQFSLIAGKVVLERVRNYFQSWRQFSDRVISFKNKLLEKRARKVFKALNAKKQQIIEARERFCKIQSRMVQLSMKSLQMYTSRRLQNKLIGNKAGNIHKRAVYSRYFPAWLQLHQYYRHLMKESFAKRSMARAIYLKKYLISIKQYALIHSYKRTAIASMLRQHLIRLITKSFSALHEYSIKSLTLRINKMRVQAKVEKRMKEGYLKAWNKRSLIEGYSFKTKEKRLKMKLFQVLKKNVSYNQLLRQIVYVSKEHYDRAIVGKAWRAIKGKLIKKYRLARIFNVIQRKKPDQLQEKAWNSLMINQQKQMEQKAHMLNAELFRKKCLMHYNFKKFKKGLFKIQTLQISEENLIKKRRANILRQMLSMMNFKAQYELDLKQREEHFIISKQRNLLRKSFYLMLTSYYRKKANEQLLIERNQLRIKCLIFANWHSFSANRANFKKNIKRFIDNRRIRQLYSYWQEWYQIASKKQFRLQLKKVAAVMFLTKFLTKCINAFKDNYSKRKGQKRISIQIRLFQLKRAFKNFKKEITFNLNSKKVLKRKQEYLLNQLYSFWYSYTQYQRALKQKQSFNEQSKSKRILQSCFKILYENSGFGNTKSNQRCTQILQRKMDSKLQKIIYSWWQYANKKQALKQIEHRFVNKQHSKQVNEIMSNWKETAYYQYFEREIFKPYVIRKQRKLVSKNFNLLKQYAINRQKNRVINEQIRSYYLNQKIIIAFRMFCIAVQQRKIKVERMQQAQEYFAENVAKGVINRLKARCSLQKCIKLKEEEITKNHNLKIISFMLSAWISRFNKEQIRKSAFSKIRNVLNQVIQQRAFQSLIDFTTYKRQKRMMKESLKAYKQQLNLLMLSQIRNRYFGYWRRRFTKFLKAKYKQQREDKIKQIKELSNYLTMRKAFSNLIKNILARKQQRQALREAMNIIEQNIMKSSFHQLYNNLMKSREADAFIIRMNRKTSLKVIKALQKYLLEQKSMNKIKVKSNAFNRVRLLKLGIQFLAEKRNSQKKYRDCYKKISDSYQKSLKSRTFIVLQWYQMKHMYFNSLTIKAYNKHIDSVQTKVFNHLKKLLLLKYQENQIKAIHDYKALSKIFKQWHSTLYQSLSSEENSLNDCTQSDD